ncbi:lamin tail domain-containing protein [Akkermansiaceae bacterium]|nr:lamin tail domain-containing protein [Akkermansiaceae bacterium]
MNATHTFIAIIVATAGSLVSEGSIIINEFMAGNDTTVAPNSVPGRFDDWIELHNTGVIAQDMGGWRLTNNPNGSSAWIFPAETIVPANGYLIVFASGDNTPDTKRNLHTNFKLAKSGEYLALMAPDESISSEFGPAGSSYPNQSDDISYGVHPVTDRIVFFENPTPGAKNDADGIARVAPLEVSPTRGLYQNAQQITLSTTTPSATIYYTTDGSSPLTDTGNPSTNATAYTSPIRIRKTTVIRSAATANSFAPSPQEAHTYLLLDIDNAKANGTDSNGLNNPILQQTRPPGYGTFPSGDYNMDTRITRSTAPSPGHNGLTIAQAMLQGFKETPSISISMPATDFVNLYANSTSQGLERSCSAEFIPAENDSRPAFQEHCGLKVQGGASRNPSSSPKHSLSFRFRTEYGAGRLGQVLFPEVDVDNFNSIALRAGYNNSWIHRDSGQRSRGSMIRDQWMRESLRDMGNQDAGAGFLAHLFVNGLYWGLHNVAERQDNAHYANYDGGDSDLIDARNGGTFVEGNSTAWNAMRSVVNTRNWKNIQQVLDVDNYIDFQIIQIFGGNQDLKFDGNWRAAGGGPYSTPTEMRPWKLYSWDGERVLENPSSNSNPRDIVRIQSSLQAIPEYRQRFADRAHMHLTGDGALTPEKTRARWEKYAATIDKAVIAEAARWGDHRRSTAYDRDEWLTEQNRLYNSYFPVRTNNVIRQLKNSNLYPTLESPNFAINGQTSRGGFSGGNNQLTLNGETGTIYYTLDGTDPLRSDGTISPKAIPIFSGVATELVFPFESDQWRYQASSVALSPSNIVKTNPASGYNSNDWKHPQFDDGSWEEGQGLIGGRTATSINAARANTILDIGSFGGGYPAVYFRKSFEVIDAADVTSLTFSTIMDDGLIVYLNGKEMFRENMKAGTVTYNDFAIRSSNENESFETEVSIAPGDLLEGTNTLSIELHNSSANSSDLGIDVALSLSRPAGKPIINLPESALITARLKLEDEWSATVSGTFLLEQPADASNLVISEINYHPREATLLEKRDAAPLDLENKDLFEYVELTNTGATAINLADLSFTEGISLSLSPFPIAPGERAIVVRDQIAFLERYGQDLSSLIAGTFVGALDNNGEILTLLDSTGSLISSFRFDDSDSWPARPDGDGSSLELRDLTGDLSNPDSWVPSVAFHGSPGTNGPISDRRVVINEVRSADPGLDFIELHNTTASPLEIGGWLLTDSKRVYRSYELPEKTLRGLGYFTIEESQFNTPPANPITNYTGVAGSSPTTVKSNAHGLSTGDLVTIDEYNGFSKFNDSFEVIVIDQNSFMIDATFLDNTAIKGNWQTGRPFGLNSGGNGEDLWLVETNSSGQPISFVDQVEFAAAAPGTTLGRWPDGLGADTLFTMTARTPEAPNSGPALGPVFISEIHYAPTGTDSHEFVELTNTGDTAVSLEFWKLRGGLDFNFNSSHRIAAGASIVIVTFDPQINIAQTINFRDTFKITPSVTLIGPATDGPLNNSNGRVRLQKGLDDDGTDQVTTDDVHYQSTLPWPDATGGSSLTRNGAIDYGNFSSSWNAANPTPGKILETESYQNWASKNGVGIEDLDPDGDALSNLLEFSLGTDPNSHDELASLVQIAPDGTVSFTRQIDHSGVTLEFQTSTDLKTWSTRETLVSALSGSIQTRQFNLNLSDTNKTFWRLRAIAF